VTRFFLLDGHVESPEGVRRESVGLDVEKARLKVRVVAQFDIALSIGAVFGLSHRISTGPFTLDEAWGSISPGYGEV